MDDVADDPSYLCFEGGEDGGMSSDGPHQRTPSAQNLNYLDKRKIVADHQVKLEIHDRKRQLKLQLQFRLRLPNQHQSQKHSLSPSLRQHQSLNQRRRNPRKNHLTMIGVRCTVKKSNKNDVNILVNPIKKYLICAIPIFAMQIFCLYDLLYQIKSQDN